MADLLSKYFDHLADAAAWMLGRKPLTLEAALAFGLWFNLVVGFYALVRSAR